MQKCMRRKKGERSEKFVIICKLCQNIKGT